MAYTSNIAAVGASTSTAGTPMNALEWPAKRLDVERGNMHLGHSFFPWLSIQL